MLLTTFYPCWPEWASYLILYSPRSKWKAPWWAAPSTQRFLTDTQGRNGTLTPDRVLDW